MSGLFNGAYETSGKNKKAPREGLEPPTYWLTASRSTIELSGSVSAYIP